MNKKVILGSIAVVVIGAVAAVYMFTKGSCKHLRLVPSDASLVVAFDLKQLADKADYNGKLKDSKLFKKLMDKSKKMTQPKGIELLMSEVVKHPLDNGLNIFSDLYLFMQSKGQDNTTGIVVDVKNAGDFTKFVKGIKGLEKNVQEKKGYTLFTDDNDLIAWNENGLLMLYKPNYYGEGLTDELNKMFDVLMVQEQKKSMADNKDLKSALDNKQDISFFMDYGGLLNSMGDATKGSPLLGQLMENYKGIYITGGMSFENDRIVMSSKANGDEKAIEKINYLQKKGLSDKALQYITNDKVYSTMSVNLDIPKIISLISADKDVKQNMEQTAQGFGMTMKELETVFSGEIVLSMIDVIEMEMKKMDYQMNEATGEFDMIEVVSKQPMPVLGLNIGVNSRENFEKMIKTMPFPVVDGMRKFPIPYLGVNIFIVENEFGLSLTNDSTTAAGIVTNKKMMKKPTDEIAGLITAKPTAAYFNMSLPAYPASVTSFFKQSMGDKGFSAFSGYLSIFDNMKGSGDIKGADFEVNLKKGEGNSLYRLLKQCDVLPLDE